MSIVTARLSSHFCMLFWWNADNCTKFVYWVMRLPKETEMTANRCVTMTVLNGSRNWTKRRKTENTQMLSLSAEMGLLTNFTWRFLAAMARKEVWWGFELMFWREGNLPVPKGGNTFALEDCIKKKSNILINPWKKSLFVRSWWFHYGHSVYFSPVVLIVTVAGLLESPLG